MTAEDFLDLACLTYDGGARLDHPDRWAAALAVEVPDALAPATALAVAAVRGDVDGLSAALARGADPAAPSGPRDWPPLMYLTYARLPDPSPGAAVAAAGVLLAAGALAHGEWGAWDTPFTPLTGCFGEGENGPGRQPRHPDVDALAATLLAAGARVADGQTLYDRMFGRDDSHLGLLLEHGLADDPAGPALLAEQLAWALDHGLDGRVALLAAHGVDEPRRPAHWPDPATRPPVARLGTPAAVAAFAAAGGDLDATVDGETVLHHWAFLDDVEMVAALLDAGADPTRLSERFGATAYQHAEWACARRAADLLRGR